MKTILDLGCGTGDFANYLYKKNKENKIYGIDVSKENIKICNKNKKSNKHFFSVGRGEKLDFKDNFFDEIYCNEVLEHVENLEKVLSEIKRVLKNKGKFILTVPLKKSEMILKKLNPSYPKQIGHKRFFSREDIEKILKEKGFEIKKHILYNSIEHFYWSYAFKKGRKITSQLGVIDKKLPRIMRLLVMFLSREIIYLKSSAKNFPHYLIILFMHLGYPFGLVLDFLCVNKKQKIISVLIK